MNVVQPLLSTCWNLTKRYPLEASSLVLSVAEKFINLFSMSLKELNSFEIKNCMTSSTSGLPNFIFSSLNITNLVPANCKEDISFPFYNSNFLVRSRKYPSISEDQTSINPKSRSSRVVPTCPMVLGETSCDTESEFGFKRNSLTYSKMRFVITDFRNQACDMSVEQKLEREKFLTGGNALCQKQIDLYPYLSPEARSKNPHLGTDTDIITKLDLKELNLIESVPFYLSSLSDSCVIWRDSVWTSTLQNHYSQVSNLFGKMILGTDKARGFSFLGYLIAPMAHNIMGMTGFMATLGLREMVNIQSEILESVSSAMNGLYIA